jgi:hypothetical protein
MAGGGIITKMAAVFIRMPLPPDGKYGISTTMAALEESFDEPPKPR